MATDHATHTSPQADCPECEACCILGICCPPASESQRAALAAKMATDLTVPVTECRPYADWVIDHFDLAPVSTLRRYAAAIAALVRHDDAEPKG
jgi:hypothetical protein